MKRAKDDEKSKRWKSNQKDKIVVEISKVISKVISDVISEIKFLL